MEYQGLDFIFLPETTKKIKMKNDKIYELVSFKTVVIRQQIEKSLKDGKQSVFRVVPVSYSSPSLPAAVIF